MLAFQIYLIVGKESISSTTYNLIYLYTRKDVMKDPQSRWAEREICGIERNSISNSNFSLYQSAESVIKAIDRHGNVPRVLYDLTDPAQHPDCQYNAGALRLRLPRYRWFTAALRFFPKTREKRAVFFRAQSLSTIRSGAGRINGGGSAFIPEPPNRGIDSYYHDRVPGLVLTYLLRVSE